MDIQDILWLIFVFEKMIKSILVIITILLSRQNENENHMEKSFLTKNCQGFCYDSLLHVRDMALKMAIFGLETLDKPWISSWGLKGLTSTKTQLGRTAQICWILDENKVKSMLV